jgi:broad specificity phosphatase PhoE
MFRGYEEAGSVGRQEPSSGREPPMIIHVVRHGTTSMNRENRYRGRRDVPLDEGGWRDAREAAERLRDVGLSRVYSSPNQRTRDTASVIGRVAGVPSEELEGLYNLDYGAWEGLTAHEASVRDPEEYRLYQERPLEAVCPGGEALADAAERMLGALRTIGERDPGQVVAAVSHAVMVRLAVAVLTGRSGPEWRIPLATGSITRFDVRGRSIELATPRNPGTIELEERIAL